LPPAPAITLTLHESTNFTGPRRSLACLLEAPLPRGQRARCNRALVRGLGHLRLTPFIHSRRLRSREGLERQLPAQSRTRFRRHGARGLLGGKL